MTAIFLSDLADADRLRFASKMLKAAQDEGAIPPDRPGLVGSEECVFALSVRRYGGCAVFYQPEDHDFLWLDVLYVVPSLRRLGVGITMLEKVFVEARQRGLSGVRLGTQVSNTPMQALAAKAGWTAESLTFHRDARRAG